jgi:hypothetical protein
MKGFEGVEVRGRKVRLEMTGAKREGGYRERESHSPEKRRERSYGGGGGGGQRKREPRKRY